MKFWKRAAGALKDQNSIWISSLSRRTSYRNPDLEAAVIKATSHDDTRVDYKNAQRVFAWIRTSPAYLKPFVWALSTRLEKTRSWVVALKGLMLMHGVFCCNVPVLQKIGRLPFDLSNFNDGYSNKANDWGYNGFVRAYFAFLDQRSTLLSMNRQNKNKQMEETMVHELEGLQEWQTLLDMLLEIKPQPEIRSVNLIIEAMDCVIIEIFDVYSRICNGVARILIRVYGESSTGRIEAAMALKVLQKARVQSENLSMYFEFCRDIGVLNPSEFPKVEQIPEEDIRDLERIINGAFSGNKIEEEKALVVREIEGGSGSGSGRRESSNRRLKTIITDEWEVFDDEDLKVNNNGGLIEFKKEEPLEKALIVHPNVEKGYNQDIPDLISFL